MKWAIQQGLRFSNKIGSIVKACGYTPIAVDVTPFLNGVNFLFSEKEHTIDIIPYGSTKLIREASSLGWRGVCINENFNDVSYCNNNPEMLNYDAKFISLPDVKLHYADSEFVFIKPTTELKAFDGGVYSISDIEKGKISNYYAACDILVSVSKLKTIYEEWRWFIVNGEVIDGAAYRISGVNAREWGYANEDKKVAQELADIWLPHETCVMDVAKTDCGWRVIEYNCLNSSGFYNHDIQKIIYAVTNYVKEKK